MKPNARIAYKPKIYRKHKNMNKSPAEWKLEHSQFLNGELPNLYSPNKIADVDSTDGESQIIYHPNVNTTLQNAMPAEMLRVKQAVKIEPAIDPEPESQVEKELTESQKLRQEGKFLRAKERCDYLGRVYRLGVNKNGWNRPPDCGF